MSGGGDGMGPTDPDSGEFSLVVAADEFSAGSADRSGGDGIGSADPGSGEFSAGCEKTSVGNGGIGATDPGSGGLPLPYTAK